GAGDGNEVGTRLTVNVFPVPRVVRLSVPPPVTRSAVGEVGSWSKSYRPFGRQTMPTAVSVPGPPPGRPGARVPPALTVTTPPYGAVPLMVPVPPRVPPLLTRNGAMLVAAVAPLNSSVPWLTWTGPLCVRVAGRIRVPPPALM